MWRIAGSLRMVKVHMCTGWKTLFPSSEPAGDISRFVGKYLSRACSAPLSCIRRSLDVHILFPDVYGRPRMAGSKKINFSVLPKRSKVPFYF